MQLSRFLVVCMLLVSGLEAAGILEKEVLEDATSKQAVCNDGTAPVYYKRLS